MGTKTSQRRINILWCYYGELCCVPTDAVDDDDDDDDDNDDGEKIKTSDD